MSLGVGHTDVAQQIVCRGGREVPEWLSTYRDDLYSRGSVLCVVDGIKVRFECTSVILVAWVSQCQSREATRPGAHTQFSSVQLLSRVRLSATPWVAARQASLSITNSRSSLRLNVHWVHDAIQPSHPLSSPSPPAPNPSQHQGLCQWVNSLHEVAKVLEFQYNNHIYLRMYSGIKWQISTMQKLQLLLHQPNIVHPWRGKAFMCSSIFVAQVYVSFSPPTLGIFHIF